MTAVVARPPDTAVPPARGPARRGAAEFAGLAALVAAIVAFAGWWWWAWRDGMPLFIDEAGYLSFAMGHARALEDGGLGDFARSLDRQGPYGPLVTGVTALGLVVVDRPVLVGAATMVGGLALLVVATWFLARRFCGARWAVLAAAVVGTLPGVVTLTGVYYFAVPAAALFTLGLGCLVRAEGGARIGWMVATGAAFGLAALARTMVVGLVPAAAVVALAAALWPGEGRGRRLAGTAAGGATGLAVAMAWYARNSRRVADYLGTDPVATGGGGGGHAWQVPGMRDLRLLVSDLLVPAVLVVAVAGAVAAAAALARRRSGTRPDEHRVPGDLGLAAPAAVVVVGAGVLMTAAQAVGQWLPLVPALVVVVVAGVARAPAGRARTAVAVALCALAVLHVTEMSRLVAPLSRPREVAAGPFGRLPVTDARWLLEDQVPQELDGGGRLPDRFRDTGAVIDEAIGQAAVVAASAGEQPVLVMPGGADPLVNLNTVRFADLIRTGAGDSAGPPLVVGVLALEPGVTPTELRETLADPAQGLPNLVLTVRPDPRYERALTVHDDVSRALPGLGFAPVLARDLPDERPVTLWWRPGSAPR